MTTIAADDRFESINGRFSRVDLRLERMQGDITLLKRMVGAVFALLVPMFLRTVLN